MTVDKNLRSVKEELIGLYSVDSITAVIKDVMLIKSGFAAML